mmetsp:Transcript_7936/g.19738  ORF Transcript_7936/g.19738 Transcript_7936/m.19738 type:complete len:402 (+) Transcript_7936:98-1303(+)
MVGVFFSSSGSRQNQPGGFRRVDRRGGSHGSLLVLVDGGLRFLFVVSVTRVLLRLVVVLLPLRLFLLEDLVELLLGVVGGDRDRQDAEDDADDHDDDGDPGADGTLLVCVWVVAFRVRAAADGREASGGGPKEDVQDGSGQHRDAGDDVVPQLNAGDARHVIQDVEGDDRAQPQQNHDPQPLVHEGVVQRLEDRVLFREPPHASVPEQVPSQQEGGDGSQARADPDGGRSQQDAPSEASEAGGEDEARAQRQDGSRNEEYGRQEIQGHEGEDAGDDVVLDPLQKGDEAAKDPPVRPRIDDHEDDQAQQEETDRDLLDASGLLGRRVFFGGGGGIGFFGGGSLRDDEVGLVLGGFFRGSCCCCCCCGFVVVGGHDDGMMLMRFVESMEKKSRDEFDRISCFG